MRLIQWLSSRLNRQPGKDAPVADTGPRRLPDVDTRRREMAAHVLRPDTLEPTCLPSGIRHPDRLRDTADIETYVDRLATAGGLDEYVSDTLDALISDQLVGWNAAVDDQTPSRVITHMRLGAQELEDLTHMVQVVGDLRTQLVDLDYEIDGWRGVLRGASCLPLRTPSVARTTDAAEPLALPAASLLGGVARTVLAAHVTAMPSQLHEQSPNHATEGTCLDGQLVLFPVPRGTAPSPVAHEGFSAPVTRTSPDTPTLSDGPDAPAGRASAV